MVNYLFTVQYREYASSTSTNAAMGKRCSVKLCGKNYKTVSVFILNEKKALMFKNVFGYEFEEKGKGAVYICEEHFDDSFILR